MKRYDFFYRQLVNQGHVDSAFDATEDGINAVVVDAGQIGIIEGLENSERSPNALSINVTAGKARDQDGNRITLPVDTIIPLDADLDDVSTDVGIAGREKWLAVYAAFDRNLSDPQVDGNGDNVYFQRDEYHRFFVEQGSEATIGLATRPALRSDAILLCDVRRTYGDSTIAEADISRTRRQHAFDLSAGSYVIQVGTPAEADQAILEALNDHVTGASDVHAASAVSYAGGGAWQDGTTNPATTVELQLDKVVSDLAATSGDGISKIGSAAIVGVSSTIAAGTARSQLVALKVAANIDLAARTAWLGGRTNPAATLQAGIDKIITDLGLTSTNDDGMERIGGAAVASSPSSLSSGSARSQADELLGFVNARARIASNETITGTWQFTQTLTTAAIGAGAITATSVAASGAVSGTTGTFSGLLTAQAGVSVTGGVSASGALSGASSSVSGAASSGSASTGDFTATGTTTLSGRRILRRARVEVTDSSQTIDVTQGDLFVLPALNAAPRTITLKSTSPAVPSAGERLEFAWHSSTPGGGTQYTFRREDATTIATFVGPTVAGKASCYAEFEFVGGVWRLSRSSGAAYDGADYGVLPGAGA